MSPTVFSKHGLLWACNLSTGLTVHHTHTHTHTHTHRENESSQVMSAECATVCCIRVIIYGERHKCPPGLFFYVCVCVCASHSCELQQQSDEEKTN